MSGVVTHDLALLSGLPSYPINVAAKSSGHLGVQKPLRKATLSESTNQGALSGRASLGLFDLLARATANRGVAWQTNLEAIMPRLLVLLKE